MSSRDDCEVVVGLVNKTWLVDLGVTLPEWYPNAALVSDEADPNTFNRFVMAHELGHLVPSGSGYWDHNALVAGEGFDVTKRADRRASVYALPPTNEPNPRTISDFMNELPVESPPPERLWIAPTQYATLMGRFAASASVSEVTADSRIVVSGAIVPNTGATTLLPWYVVPSGTWTAPKVGPYVLEFWAGSTKLASHSFGVYDDGVNLSKPWPFTLKVPLPAGATIAKIMKPPSGTPLATVTTSSASASITAPAAGATWSGVQTIAWSGSAGGYAVDFSADNGATWIPLAIDLDVTSLTIDTRGLPNTTQARVRVAASQGLTTATVVSGAFTVANAPVVCSLSPQSGETGVAVGQPVVVGFSDSMDPATLTASTFYVQVGGAGVPGTITYSADDRTATFTPKSRLAYSTTYTVNVTTGVRNAAGVAIAAGRTWTFTTEADRTAPRPVAFQPAQGSAEVARDARVAITFDKPLNAGTTAGKLTLAVAKTSATVAGAVSYDATTRTLTFAPSAALAARTTYRVTLKSGIADTLGNATMADSSWLFTTGRASAAATALSGSYGDYRSDTNGDGLYEWLVVRVGVQVTAAAKYGLSGTLVDINGERIGSAATQVTLPVGFSWVDLSFSGQEIGGHGVDGPYRLTNVLLFKLDASDQPLWATAVSAADAAATRAYPASRFASALRLSGIPDVRLMPGSASPIALNLSSYTQTSLTPVKYNIVGNTDPTAGVTVSAAGIVSVYPPAGEELPWASVPPYRGSTHVTVEAVSGSTRARDTFQVVVDWASRIALPGVFRQVTPSTVTQSARPTWHVRIDDKFEGDSMGWSKWSGITCVGGNPECTLGWYLPDQRACRAYSGTKSVWPFGGYDDGANLPCGAPYPNGYTGMFGSLGGVSLKHTSAAEWRIKVWTNLDPAIDPHPYGDPDQPSQDQICALVSLTTYTDGYGSTRITGPYYGVCKTGVSNGWEDLVLNLSNVPGYGSMLGAEKVYPVVKFATTQHGNRPEGAYIDDAVFRICPEGMRCE